jgi:chromosome partitioning protein
MGRIIAVTNLKGGIGKTTTVANVSAGLALKGARVLLVDIDAQGNLAPALGVTPRHTIYEMLVDGARPEKCIIPARPNLDLIGADDSLLSAQTTLSQRPDWSRVLEQALRPLKKEYDFIFIDAPGSLTLLSVNALVASNDLLVPTTVEHLSIKGLALLFKQVSRIKNSTSSIRIIVPTMFDSRLRQSASLLEQLKTNYGALIASPIRVNVRISEATSEGRTIYEYDPRSRGALDYAHLVDQLSDMWNFRPAPPPARPHSQPDTPAPAGRSNGVHAHANAAEPARASVQVQAPEAAPQQGKGQADSSPMVIGGGNMSRLTCPHCGRPLQRTTIAGYRVAFCDHCKYKQQELVASSR